jgi:hypothetical protein
MHWLDPQYLPETKGMLERFLLASRGDAACKTTRSTVREKPTL